MKKILFNSIGLIVLIVLYYMPLYLNNDFFSIHEPRVSYLLNELLSSKETIFYLLINLSVNFISLLILYILILFFTDRLNKKIKIKKILSIIIVSIIALAFLNSLNYKYFKLSEYSYFFSNLNNEPAFYLSSISILTLVLITTNINLIKLKSIAAIFILFFLFNSLQENIKKPILENKNIIIIGIDSLSAAALEQTKDNLKKIGELSDQAVMYPNAYTSLGRTFPAWLSILSGKYPADHGAIFNLRNLSKIKKEDLLTWDLKKANYETIFAIDERRFNNLDSSFGFDKIIGPKTGALDFILQKFNDTPINNILLQFKISKKLLPFSYINTASYANYSSKGFINSIMDSITGDKNIFLSVHFESAHFPFKSRHSKKISESDNIFKKNHFNSLTTVDEQIEDLLNGLSSRGYLKNSLIIFLSDHGEGIGEVEANITKGGEETIIKSYGHGSDLLSEHQNRIVLGVVKFEDGIIVNKSKKDMKQVSLLDIRSLIKRYLNNGSYDIKTDRECLIVETGIRFSAAEDYRSFNESELAKQSANYYEINIDGFLQIREDTLPILASRKDIGLRCPNSLTYYSYIEKRYYSYLLSEKGLPTIEINPIYSAIDQIEKYRQRTIKKLIENIE